MSTATQTRTQGADAADPIELIEPTTPVMSREQLTEAAIEAIRKEHGCDAEPASDFMGYLATTVSYGTGEYHLTGDDYARFHDVYATTIPAHTDSIPGTAHAAIEAALGDEHTVVALQHTGTTREGVRDCSTTVTVTRVGA